MHISFQIFGTTGDMKGISSTGFFQVIFFVSFSLTGLLDQHSDHSIDLVHNVTDMFIENHCLNFDE